jgi:superfamily I DNA and RNA helicase
LALKRHTGYTADGTQTYSDGQLLAESVRRFKGQAADAVVITEVDFEELDPMAKRMLFVTITRSRLQVMLVTSIKERNALLKHLKND